MSIPSLQLEVAYVGAKILPDKTFQGKTLMFCNGINNDLDDAKKSARIISEAFGGRQVVVCHNTTIAKDIAEDFLGSDLKKEKNLSMLLGTKITEFLTKNTSLLILFVHSHGALLAKKALKCLDSNNRDKVRVYSFGGITMIPKRLANRVENYIFDEDVVAFFGNTIKGVPEVLIKVLSISAFVLKNLCPVNQAIKDKSQAEVDNRQNGDNQTYEEKVDSYLKCFEDYNIKVLQIAKGRDQRYSQSELNDTSSNEDLPAYQGSSFLIGAIRDFRIGIRQATKGVSEIGAPLRELNEGISNAKKNHAFSSFKNVAQSIAQRELSTPSIDNDDLEHQLLELRNELCNRILDVNHTSITQTSNPYTVGSKSSVSISPTNNNSNSFSINNNSEPSSPSNLKSSPSVSNPFVQSTKTNNNSQAIQPTASHPQSLNPFHRPNPFAQNTTYSQPQMTQPVPSQQSGQSQVNNPFRSFALCFYSLFSLIGVDLRTFECLIEFASEDSDFAKIGKAVDFLNNLRKSTMLPPIVIDTLNSSPENIISIYREAYQEVLDENLLRFWIGVKDSEVDDFLAKKEHLPLKEKTALFRLWLKAHPELYQCISLNISNNLTVLPPEITNFNKLNMLGLSLNQLVFIPDYVGNFTNLTHLDLGGNKLSFLPTTIGELSNLEVLGLRENRFHHLPDSIGNLTNLLILDVGNNQLQKLPIFIEHLNKLAYLEFSGNPLLSFSEETMVLLEKIENRKMLFDEKLEHDLKEGFKNCIIS